MQYVLLKLLLKAWPCARHVTKSVTTSGSKSTYSSRPGPEPPSLRCTGRHVQTFSKLGVVTSVPQVKAAQQPPPPPPRSGGPRKPHSTYVEPQQRPVRIAAPGPPAQVLVGGVEQHEGGWEHGRLGHRWGKTRRTGSEPRRGTGGSCRHSLSCAFLTKVATDLSFFPSFLIF